MREASNQDRQAQRRRTEMYSGSKHAHGLVGCSGRAETNLENVCCPSVFVWEQSHVGQAAFQGCLHWRTTRRVLKVSRCRTFRCSRLQDVKASRPSLQGFKNSRLQGVKASRFQSFKCSMFRCLQGLKVSRLQCLNFASVKAYRFH